VLLVVKAVTMFVRQTHDIFGMVVELEGIKGWYGSHLVGSVGAEPTECAQQ